MLGEELLRVLFVGMALFLGLRFFQVLMQGWNEGLGKRVFAGAGECSCEALVVSGG